MHNIVTLTLLVPFWDFGDFRTRDLNEYRTRDCQLLFNVCEHVLPLLYFVHTPHS